MWPSQLSLRFQMIKLTNTAKSYAIVEGYGNQKRGQKLLAAENNFIESKYSKIGNLTWLTVFKNNFKYILLLIHIHVIVNVVRT